MDFNEYRAFEDSFYDGSGRRNSGICFQCNDYTGYEGNFMAGKLGVEEENGEAEKGGFANLKLVMDSTKGVKT